MKKAEELANSAFKWAENQAKMVQASIDAGNLSPEELEDAKKRIAEFEELKKSFMESKEFCSIKKFAAENTDEVDSNDALVFAIIRKLVVSVADDGESHDELFDSINAKLVELGMDPNILTSVINHVAKLKGFEFSDADEDCYQTYDSLVTDEISDQVDAMDVNPENINDLIAENQYKVIKFAGGDGLNMVKSGVKFLEQIKDRKVNSNNPDEDEIAEYDKAIDSLNQFISEESKSKNFSATAPEGVAAEVIGNTQCIRYSKGDKELVLCVSHDLDGTVTKVMDGEDEVPVESMDKYIEDHLNDPEVSVDVDPETDEVIK